MIGHERETSFHAPRRQNGKLAPVMLQESEIGKHFALHARTGAGKSFTLLNIVEQWIGQTGRGLVLFDPDGSQAPQIATMVGRLTPLEDVGKRLIYISLDENDWTIPLNVLAGADESTALLILDAVEQQFGADFGPNVSRAMRAAIFTATRCQLAFGDIPLLFSCKSLRQKLAPQSDTISQRFWREFDTDLSAEQQRTFARPVVTRIEHWLSSSAIRTALSHPRGLSFRSLFEQRPDTVIVINLATRRAAGASRLLAALIWAQLQSQLLHPDRTHPGTRPILVCADEYQNIISSSDALMTCLAESRKYKISLGLASQIFSRIPTALRDSILGNCHSLFAFSSGDSECFSSLVHFEGDPIPRSAITTFLSRQDVAQSVLIRPGLPSLPIAHLKPTLLDGAPKGVGDAAILASYQNWGIRRAEIESFLERRHEQLSSPLPAAPAPDTSAAHASPHPAFARPVAPDPPRPDLSQPDLPKNIRRASRRPLIRDDAPSDALGEEPTDLTKGTS